MAGDLEVDVVIRCNALCKPPTAWASLHRLLLHSHGSCVLVLKVRLAKATTDLLTIWPVLGMASVAKHTAARCKTYLCARIVICNAHGRAHWRCNDHCALARTISSGRVESSVRRWLRLHSCSTVRPWRASSFTPTEKEKSCCG